MWIVDEIRYLRELIVRSIRRLLNVLSMAASETRAEVACLLHKYHCLLFEDTPTKIHRAMVDFSRWLADVLVGRNAKGIERSPSHREDAWLTLKERHFDDRTCQGALAFNKTTTIQLLRTACEYYMARCDCLQRTNAGLVSQLAELKTQLKQTLVCAFESQHALEREREVCALQAKHLVTGAQIGDHLVLQRSRGEYPARLRQQIASTLDTPDVVNTAEQDDNEQALAGASSSNDPKQVNAVENASVGDKLGAATLDNREDALSPLSGADGNNVLSDRQETPQHSSGQQRSASATSSSVAMYEPSLSSTDLDYRQLTELRSSGEKDGRWYSHALRALKEARKHRKRRQLGEAHPMMMFTASAVCKEANATEFTQLVSTRDPAEDGEDSTWYRRTLLHLTNERQRRLSHHNRADSFSSTISIVD
ncbi:unnamed protein product [Hyaloperonospora brassicae]|uniref:Uncharacterized protein n=1 Tax=Hyaloperonospora brassicae TaxID=162125 RepID=A0AAV0TZV1_HYABA|nr:unnamed protein product [Hyaloperonospora brassicae]